jgi:acyl-CoA synthetase (AMP-forming)/AMP-acid ligase II
MIRANLIAPVPALIARQAAAHPRKTAFRDAHGAVTYAELATTTAALAGHLQAAGVGAGERVAIFLPNSVAWVESCFAVTRAGAVGVPVSYDAALPELAYRLADAGCTAIVTTDERAHQIADLLASLPPMKAVILADRGQRYPKGDRYAEIRAAAPAQAPRDPDNLDDPAWILYTSGTTGRAKGVLLTPRGMLWVAAVGCAPVLGLCEADHVLSPLPLFHSYALNFSVLSVLAVGASEYILERYSTQEVMTQLREGGYTVMPGVPTMFHYLLEAARAEPAFAMRGMRICLSAGAIMPGTLNRAFEERFGVPLLDGYGITETSTFVTMNAPGASRVDGSCGLPLPGGPTRIVNPQDGRDVNAGEEGELIVRGPHVMPGYHGKPEETAKAIRDGWYHTGDLARADANGFITITGRLKELIIRGGQNIAPAEVEEVVVQHADVLDCAVVAGRHEHLGEVPVAFVVPRQGVALDVEALLVHCRAQLSAYKVPHAVRLIEAIPRTGSGKTIRYKLRELLDQEPPR